MFQINHGKDRTVVYPYGKNFKIDCIFLEEDGSYLIHTKKGNTLGKLDKPRSEYTLKELQDFCSLIVS